MRNRPLRVVVCFSHDEYAQYLKQLKASGLTKQAHALKALLGEEIKPRLCTHHAALLKALSDISNDVNNILRTLHSDMRPAEQQLDLLAERIDACWTHIRDF